jgi:hypothetical protein
MPSSILAQEVSSAHYIVDIRLIIMGITKEHKLKPNCLTEAAKLLCSL